MSRRSFALRPFLPGQDAIVKITGEVFRRGANLAISYELRGDLAAIVIPPPAPPTRSHNLWQATCGEFFLGPPRVPNYWEFNLSPAGHWNVYRFQDYRLGMAEETAFDSLPMRVRKEDDSLLLALEVDLSSIIPAGQALEMGITAVIALAGGEFSYWALSHPGSRPDFHRRDSFVMVWPGENPGGD